MQQHLFSGTTKRLLVVSSGRDFTIRMCSENARFTQNNNTFDAPFNFLFTGELFKSNVLPVRIGIEGI